MRDYMDDLLEQALQDTVRPSGRLEQDTMVKMTTAKMTTAKMTDDSRKRSFVFPRRSGEGRRLRPVMAVFALMLLLGSAATAYAAAGGLTVGQLFAHIWNERNEGTSLEEIGSKVNVLAEKSTFEDISIKPVKVISDSYMTYVVMKVEGEHGFRLTDEMTFENFSLENRQKGASALNSFVLKREGNVMYVALQMSTLKIKKYHYQKFSVDIYNLHHAVLDEMGRCMKVKNMAEEPGEGGTTYESYTEASFAAKGEYHAEILCTVRDKRVKIPMGDSAAFDVYTLGVFLDKDISRKIENLSAADWEERGIFVIMEDGSEIQAVPDGGFEGVCNTFELREPIDPEQVKGIRVLDEIYYRKGKQ